MRPTWLVDASVLLAREDPTDPHHGAARRLLSGPDRLATLDLAFYEVTNVAIRAWRDRAAAARLRALVAALGGDAGLVRVDEALVADAAALAEQHGLSGYDGAYLAAAGRLGAELVSCDLRDLVGPGLARLPEHATAA